MSALVSTPARSLCARGSTSSAPAPSGGVPVASGVLVQPNSEDESESSCGSDAPDEDPPKPRRSRSTSPSYSHSESDINGHYVLWGLDGGGVINCAADEWEQHVLPSARARDGYVVYDSTFVSGAITSSDAAERVLTALESERAADRSFEPGRPCFVPSRVAHLYPGVRTDGAAIRRWAPPCRRPLRLL